MITNKQKFVQSVEKSHTTEKCYIKKEKQIVLRLNHSRGPHFCSEISSRSPIFISLNWVPIFENSLQLVQLVVQ